MNTYLIAGGVTFSFLMWFFIIAIFIKVFNSAFKETKQHDSTKKIKRLILNNNQKDENFKPDRI